MSATALAFSHFGIYVHELAEAHAARCRASGRAPNGGRRWHG
jgi:hypothetical protein